MPKWTQNDIPDLSGRIVVVTGANSGLGFECSKAFAQHGATLVMAVRNLQKGQAAKAAILEATPAANIDVLKLDLSSLDSVSAFASTFKAKYDRLDILLNNAGLMAIPHQLTDDGFEMQFGVNHLGHFTLTAHLLDVIINTPGARIHNVSSVAHYGGHINFDDLMGEQHYTRWGAYAQSKLANVMFSFELQRRLRAAGYDTLVNSSHPGVVLGQLYDRSVRESGTWYEGVVYFFAPLFVSQPARIGVLPMLYGMTSPDAQGGAFYTPAIAHLHGGPKERRANREAYDVDECVRLWRASERLTGTEFDL